MQGELLHVFLPTLLDLLCRNKVLKLKKKEREVQDLEKQQQSVDAPVYQGLSQCPSRSEVREYLIVVLFHLLPTQGNKEAIEPSGCVFV